MAMPEIPDLKPDIQLDQDEVIKVLLTSLALEELSLAHITNAEAEKLQSVLKNSSNLDELMEANEAVTKALKTVIKKEILLQDKFENILELLKAKERKKYHRSHNIH